MVLSYFHTYVPYCICAIGNTAVRRVATLVHDDAMNMQTWYFLSVPATSHKRCGSTDNAFLSLTRNSGSTILTPSPYGTSPISFHSQGRKGYSTANPLPLMRHESRASNVASPKLLPLGNAYTSMAFLSLTRNSGSTNNHIAIGAIWLR